MIHKIILIPNKISIYLYPTLPIVKALCYKKDISQIDILNIPIKLSVSKDGAIAIIGDLEKTSEIVAQHILAITRLSFQYNKWLQEGNFSSAEELSRYINKDGKYICSIISLRFLAPQILECILSQNIPAHWILILLFKESKFNDWQMQTNILFESAFSTSCASAFHN